MPLDRGEGVRTRRTKEHLGFGDRSLNPREILVRTVTGKLDLALDDFEEHIDGRARDPERDARTLGQDRVVAPPDGTLALGRLQEAEGMAFGDEEIGHAIVIAA